MISAGGSWFGGLSARLRALRLPGLRLTMLGSFGLLFALALAGLQQAQDEGIPWLGFRGDTERAQTEALKNLSATADLKKARLSGWLEERRDDVQVLADSEFVRNRVAAVLHAGERLNGIAGAANDRDLQLLVEHLRMVATSYAVYDVIQIVDAATGTVIASTAQGGPDASVPARFIRDSTERPWEGSLTLMADAETKAPRLRLSRAIRAPAASGGQSSEILAVMMAMVNLDDVLGPILHAGGGLGETGEALLVDEDARIITSLKHPLADGSTAEPMDYQITARPAALAAQRQEGLITATDYRGEPVLAAYRYIPLTASTGWGMVVKRDRAEVFAPLQQRQTHGLILGSATLLVVLGVAYLIATTVSRPMRALSETARRVTGGDMEARATVAGTQEVRVFAATFNSMVERVGQRTVELERSNRELEAFSYAVSHDLRAPLRAIDGFSLALAEDHAEDLDDEARQLLGRVRSASQQMGSLIDDILDLSRVSSMKMKTEPLDLSAIAADVARDLRDGDRDREVEVVVAPRLRAAGDQGLVHVVLQNLLDNAWKFTRENPAARIEFDGQRIDGRTVFRVRDNGVGFDMRYVEKLFQPFQRLHSAEEFEGNGIGLATVRQAVDRHGGEAWAEGTVGEGASFFFILEGSHDG